MSEQESHTEVQIGSEKSFGIVFAFVFAVIGVWPMLNGGGIRFWAVGIAILFLVAAYLKPSLLAMPNRLWFRFGLLLNKIMSPIIMGLIFVLTVIPTGFVMRALGKDLLRKKMDPDAESYWITPDAAQQQSSSMKNQF